MQPTSGGGGGGLARFRSAPATWLEALLESEEEDVIGPPKPNTQSLTTTHQQPSIRTSSSATTYVGPSLLSSCGVGSAFLRQNSSPAVFLAQINNSNGCFSDFGIPANYDYLSSALNSPGSKPSRDVGLEDSPLKFSTQLSGEHSGLLDVEMDKLLEDSVPCRVRAKRGCATHPRSLAERARRTRISDRIRKLQELVPNMDKQTNTADMLEEAAEYVKFLQKQIQELMEHQKNCRCLVKD